MKSVSKIITAVLLTAVCSAHTFAQINMDGTDASDAGYYDYTSGVLTIKGNGTYTVTGNTGRIVVNINLNAVNITLNNVNLDVISSGDCAFEIGNGSTVNLTLEGTNTLKSGYLKAGLQVPAGSTLEIRAASDVPSLTTTGGSTGAGIGGGFFEDGGTINIYGGTVSATGQSGAGIGGGNQKSGGTINIYGGTVTANGGSVGAGIGGCTAGSGGTINIYGGTVTASGGSYSAGIGGGGSSGSGGIITISGGTVRASSGSFNGASIGGGGGNTGSGTVIITGGSIYMNNQSGPTPGNGAGQTVYLNTLTLSGAGNDISVTAGSIGGVPCAETANAPAGVYGIRDVKTSDGGKVYFYLPPAGNESVKLTAGVNGYGKPYSRGSGSISQTLDLLQHDITLSQTGNHPFGSATYGYATSPAAHPVTVTNTGSTPTGALTVTLSGDPSAFTTSAVSPPSIGASGSTAGFTVTPKPGLAAGPHTETVTVSGDNGSTATFTVSFTVNKIALTKEDHLDCILTDAIWDGQPHGIGTLTLKNPYTGMGTPAVYYTSTDGTSYPKSTNAPAAVGAYTVTADIPEGANFLAADLTLGTFTIGKIALTAAHLDYALADTTYDGTPHGIGTLTLKNPYTGMGTTLTVYYTSTDGTTYPKSEDAPVNAGDYDVTVDVTEGSIFAAAVDLSLGSYTIAPAEPTVDDLDFDLSDIVDTGKPLSGIGVGSAAGFEGLGEVTVKYDGLTQIPSLPGTYTVTVDIAAGDNYLAIEGLVLGTFTIHELAIPVIRRRVTLLPASGLTTDPPADTYYISSGTDFTFTLTPDVPSPDGTPPQVQTNRAGVPDSSTGIRMTANADGSYTVVIAAVRQDIDVLLAIPADNAPVADGALTVGTAPGVLVVANGRPAPVTLRVYSLAGVLVRQTTVPPGTTRLAVATGIYVVTDGGTFYQKRVVTR